MEEIRRRVMARNQKLIVVCETASPSSSPSRKPDPASSGFRDPRIRPMGVGRRPSTPTDATPANEQDAEAAREARVEKLFRGMATVKWPIDQSE